MKSLWLGSTDYVTGVKTQESVIDTILGLEHPLTITLGKRANPLSDIKVSVKVLRERKIPIVGIDRGGQATLHNPGQLVIYPILDLRACDLRVREYVKLLESATCRLLARFQIPAACQSGEPGLYTSEGKIAFFGVRIRQGITSHGVAINVSNDLADFQLIRSCGKATETFARMADYGVNTPLEELFKIWCEEFELGLSLVEPLELPSLALPVLSAATPALPVSSAATPALTTEMTAPMLENPSDLRV